MLPVRCFTCNLLIGHLWNDFHARRHVEQPADIMDSMGITRICCRRMLLTHVPVIDDIITYGNVDESLDENGTVMLRRVEGTRVVSCD